MITISKTKTENIGKCYARYHFIAKTDSIFPFFKESPEYSWESEESIKKKKTKVLEAMKIFCGSGNYGNGSINKQVRLEDETWELHYSYEVDSGD